MGNYIYSNPKPQGQAKKDLLLNLKQSDGTTYVYPTQPLVIKKKKAMFVNKPTISNRDRGDDEDEERRPREVQKSIKLIRKEQDKNDLLLRKRRFEELSLKKTSFNAKNKELLENYKEEEDEEELETLKKAFIREDEEEVEVPEEAGSEAVEEEAEVGGEEEAEVPEENQSRDVNSERDVDEGEEEYKGAGSEAAPEPEEENKMAEEEEVPEPVTEKPAATEDKISTFKRPKSDSEDDRYNILELFKIII